MGKPGLGADANRGRGSCQPGAFHPAPPGPKAYPLPIGGLLAGPGPGRPGPAGPVHVEYGPAAPGMFPGPVQAEPGPAAPGVFAGLVHGDVGVFRGGSGAVGPFGPAAPVDEVDPAGAGDATSPVPTGSIPTGSVPTGSVPAGPLGPLGAPGAAGSAGSADPLVAVGSFDPAGPVSGSGRGPRGSSPAPRDPAS
ncbi:hypothetical protein Msi02_17530 [Microbispora siamensis]|uniref:Uncharacterized protein n=1 Tax=Microbispora siamensis TaxID=564413 RepID=A0ABQ4GHM9_9ACTN|nr:hypothetical protein Msi02_17530 [Microbispora siamensis]